MPKPNDSQMERIVRIKNRAKGLALVAVLLLATFGFDPKRYFWGG